MATELLSCVELEPEGEARTAVIWLHGLGADGHDFVPITPMLGLPRDTATRFVFPHAPLRPVTINAGLVMRAWYDIREVDLAREHDTAGIDESAAAVSLLIEREVARGVPAERIVLAGFSQGGAMALHVGTCHPERLAGIVGLSCYAVEGSARPSAANRDTPVFVAHGRSDPLVVIERGVAARDQLLAAGYPVSWHDYPMQHEVCADEIEALGAWMTPLLRSDRESD